MILSASLAIACCLAVQDGFDTARLNRIPAKMREFVAQGEVAGIVTLIQRHGKPIQVCSEGWAQIERKRPMKADTIFQVMSMTKPVTAIAVMICAERGMLNLDDRVETFLPKLAEAKVRQPDGSTKPRSRPMTVRHLLTHIAGLPSSDPGGLDDESKARLTLAEYAERFGSEPLLSEPGERIAYSGPGISAAGRIVEIVSGRRFEEFLQDEVFGPLQMKDTSFFAPKSAEERIAYMYVREDGNLRRYQNDPLRTGSRFANPAGGLYSTAADMAKLLQCLIDGGASGGFRLLSPRAVSVLTTLQTGDLLSDGNDALGYGLGFSVVRSASGTLTLRPVGSFGHTGAFGTEFWADPKSGMIAVFMSQSFSDRARKTFNTMANAAFVGP